MSALQISWFGLIGVLLAGYIVLDGFDLGVGFWYLFTKKDADRRALLSSILPYWDGNEVWLLTGGGAVFAAFPEVYATVFSGLYLALMLVLFALIFRAVSIEFRNQSDAPTWRGAWDVAFALGSVVPALLFGVAAGNILRGLPIDAFGEYTGTFFTLLNPYSLLVGVTGLAMFATHGALFAAMKTDANLSGRLLKRAEISWVLYLVLFVVSAVATVLTQPQAMVNFGNVKILWALPAAALLAILAIGHFAYRRAVLNAFLASSAAMIAIIATMAASLFPRMVPALGNPANSLTIVNASSSPLTLKTMLVLALVGVPIVLVYTVWVHRTFRGKVGDEGSY